MIHSVEVYLFITKFISVVPRELADCTPFTIPVSTE
jgi:hypothetical protein